MNRLEFPECSVEIERAIDRPRLTVTFKGGLVPVAKRSMVDGNQVVIHWDTATYADQPSPEFCGECLHYHNLPDGGCSDPCECEMVLD